MSDIANLDVFGGAACLDFANTLDGRGTESPEEYLHTYADLVSWGRYAGVLDESTARRLTGDHPAVLRTALRLREAIFQVFVALGRGQAAPTDSLATVQARYAEAMAVARLAPDGDGFDWRFDGDDPGRAWWPLAVSAVRLLTAGPLDRVKVCAAEAGCIGLFVDTSKNRSRRWCTMDGCGVDAKVQRQARRRRDARTA
ncbi:CGNR zinc finger domain-containing protein [Actinoplanes sp. NPDC051513]|uniref:CGNR zinc finger domain-containing protein n=1 Tax=Actinoplanes sp. NPDC051513 TaxID=3363908 RepID=UPI00378E9FB8